MLKIKRALLSVYYKDGLIDLARELVSFGVEIISSGGTRKVLADAGIASIAVDELTGFPEILGGRVKTLHPKVFGGILAKRNNEHLKQLADHHINEIDLVVVNLYPFEETIEQPDCTMDQAIEQIDIGGPSLIRAAAKNHRYATVLTSPDQYQEFSAEFSKNRGSVPADFRKRCAVNAFKQVARYNMAIAEYLDADDENELPEEFFLYGRKEQSLRYGENPHQNAAFYKSTRQRPLAGYEQLHGKELSFNNIVDTQAAIALVSEFDDTACVILKHTNPCGAATADTVADAYTNALKTDSLSAFGGIVGFNKALDDATAELMYSHFFECIIAPDFAPGAIARLSKKKNLRLIRYSAGSIPSSGVEIKTIYGGFLVQQRDALRVNISEAKVATEREPSAEEWQAMDFAWRVVKHVKSNAIVFARDRQLIGVGAGQMSRVDSTEIAISKAHKAELSMENTVVASDAFFPFADSIEALAKAGATAIVQPGGSIRDNEVIEAANRFGIAMVFTGHRHFKH